MVENFPNQEEFDKGKRKIAQHFKKLRGMKRFLAAPDYCGCFIAFLSVVQAIPIQHNGTDFSKAANNTLAENGGNQPICVHENAIYTEGENFSTSNPCEICVCDPPGFSCSLSSCDLKPGCKAIHRANHCCPEYVCECERNGRIYGNGEKVEEPNPCKVCYCKGGEIKCALVTCYTRDDCEPGYVAGVCCPKYDHCPPLEMMKNKSTTPAPAQVIISDLKTESTPSLLQKDVKITALNVKDEATEPTTTEKYSNSEPTTQEGTTPSEFLSTEFSEYLPYSTEFSSTAFPETTDYYATSPDLGEMTELLNETTEEDTETVTESATELYSTLNGTTDGDIFGTEEYNATSTEIFSTTPEETTTGWTGGYENKTEEYLLTESVNVTESTTIDPVAMPGIVTDMTFSTTVDDTQTDELSSTPSYESTAMTTEPDLFTFSLPIGLQESGTVAVSNEFTTEMTTEEPAEEISKSSVVKVIVPKTMKVDVDQVQNAADGPAPIVVMISADQIQFLKLAEEPPLYVENPDSGDQKPEHDHLGVMVVPKTTPTTVEMVKVVDGLMNATTEVAKSENISISFNSTDFIQER